ncbi:MAG: hypothetical protein ACR2P3_04675 [Geminicoccaceae bacterium]
MSKSILMSCLGLSVLLAGCGASDPTKGGFVGGVVGDLSGTYDDRLVRREEALLAARSRSDRALTERGELERTAATRRDDVAALQLEMAAIDEDLSKLASALEAIKTTERSNRNEISAAEVDIESLRANLSQIETRSQAQGHRSDQQATLLRAEISKLKKEVEQLDKTMNDF